MDWGFKKKQGTVSVLPEFHAGRKLNKQANIVMGSVLYWSCVSGARGREKKTNSALFGSQGTFPGAGTFGWRVSRSSPSKKGKKGYSIPQLSFPLNKLEDLNSFSQTVGNSGEVRDVIQY